MILIAPRAQYTQLCLILFEDGVERNGSIIETAEVEEMGNANPRPRAGEAYPMMHDGDWKGIVHAPVDHRAYNMNASRGIGA
jgi:hypothetical protein